MPPLADLLARLREAREGSDELDLEIALAIGWKRNTVPTPSAPYVWVDPTGLRWLMPRLFSRSLDAAMTLLPDGAYWELASRTEHDPRPIAYYWAGKLGDIEAAAATPALALCIAALTARQEKPDATD